MIVFRVDASTEIGIGHVMRCLTLAEALRLEGEDCRFVCREHKGNLFEKIQQKGFTLHKLASPRQKPLVPESLGPTDPSYSSWLGVEQATDAGETIDALGGNFPDWVVVDHYALDAQWENILRPTCGKILVIDDLANRAHNCDVLLDQNIASKQVDYLELVPSDCEIMAGPEYSLLRPEFLAKRTYSLSRRNTSELKHVLINLGGVDKNNITERVLDALVNCWLPQATRITIVMGGKAPWLLQVQKKAALLPWKSEVKVNVEDMASLMADSDLAIGAAGSTSWERCCLGLPSIIVVIAPNQEQIAKGLEEVGAVKVVQLSKLDSSIKEIFLEIESSELMLSDMGIAAAKITVGDGVHLVLKSVFNCGSVS
jgi:UDP-2,4-diacetamido-2,4,6-trideoxy-beta-L-altropyranose hydrolase